MIGLQVADLVVIAARVLGVEPADVLDRLDVTAAEAALADARSAEPARAAAELLHGLLSRGPLPEGTERVAVVAMAQFMALNGFEVTLEPPEEARRVLGKVTAGRLDAAGLADWLTPRIGPRGAARPPLLRRLVRRRRPRDRFHRYTEQARTVVALAQGEARRLGHRYIGTEHILLGLVAEADGVAAEALQARGIELAAVRDRVEEIVGHGAGAPAGHLSLTPRAKRVLLQCALREAMQLGHSHVGTEHLLLGLLREGNGLAADVLTDLGAYHVTTREQVIELLEGHLRDDRPTHPPLPDLRDVDDRIAATRREKEAALDAGDPETARRLRATEKRLREERRRRLGGWLAGADAVALAEEVDRLRALLRRHGIDPDGRAAQAGG